MSGVPYTFANATTTIALSNLDANFNTPVTIGNTAVALGNTVTTLGNVTITNATISVSGGSANGVVYLNTSNVATANASAFVFDGTNLGLGTAPSAWVSNSKALQGIGGSIWWQTSQIVMAQNYYYGSGNNYAITTSQCSDYSQYSGTHVWRVAPSTTAGTTPSFATAMTLNNSGTLVFGVSGQGIQFTNSSASTNSTLNDYETGTWTVTDQSGAGLTFTNATGSYTKIGNMVYYSIDLVFPTTSNSSSVSLSLPFTSANSTASGGFQTYNPVGNYTWYIGNNSTNVHPYTNSGASVSNATFSGKEIGVSGVYKASF